MTVFGFRSDPTAARYAIVSDAGSQLTLINAESESRLVFPAALNDESQKVTWLYREFERIFNTTPDLERIVIKKGEFTLSDNNAKRLASYQEAALLLFGGLKNIPVVTKTYNSLSTQSSLVQSHAISRVGRTEKYWNTKMADAIIAAWWGMTHP